jgi:putative nucleotidyltransferase with HDIG domain
MIKKIKVEQLKPGVFVHDFNSGWLHHPFLKNRAKIKTDNEIQKIIKYRIHEVYIDTDKGLDIDDAPTQQQVVEEIQTEIDKLSAPAQGNSRLPLKQEIADAKRFINEAKNITRHLMDDVRLGKQIDMQQVENLVDRMTQSILNSKDALISLARIKNKDEYTYLHSLAVSALCISFADHLGLDSKKIKQIGIGGLLHDIGKVKVPIGILNKPGALTEKEFEIMKQHVHHGSCILQQTKIDEPSVSVTAHHHERLDGTGYPDGLKGDQISFFGQMAAVVDIYDALTSERCYKRSMLPTQALRKLFEWSHSYLNKELVEKFIAHVGIYPIGTLVRLRSGFLGVVIRHGEKGLLYPVVRAVYNTRKEVQIVPFNIDLSKKASAGDSDEITGCESPERWNIRPYIYLVQ